MTNKELQLLLAAHPDELLIKLMPNTHNPKVVIDFNDENLLLTAETAFINDEAPEDEWDHEDGKIELGNGQRFLLVNPIIL